MSEDEAKVLERLKAKAEAAYDAMYEARSPRDANDCYRDAKDWFHEAIGFARRLGDAEETGRIEARLAHVKAVFRSQFT